MKIRYLNPRYDAPFKYLLEDNNFTKGLISVIIGKEVTELTPEPQEKIEIDAEPLKLVIYRKDYRAVIKSVENGKEKSETVKIEMQKSYLSPHIDRFREYTGAEYSKPYKVEKIVKKDKNGNDIEYEKKHYLPIITIYFIEQVFNWTLPSVLRVGKEYYDVLRRQRYTGEKDKLVEVLTHEAYFIQIKKLPPQLQKEFEVFQIFMGNFVDKQEILMELEIDMNLYQENSLLAKALFLLSSIASDKKMRRKMNEERKFEQTYLQNLKQGELIEYLDEELAKSKGALLRKNQELEQNKQELEQNKQELEQKNQKLEQNKQELEQKNQKLEQNKQELKQKNQKLEQNKQELEQNKQALLRSAKMMKNMGIDIAQIQAGTGLSKEEIEAL